MDHGTHLDKDGDLLQESLSVLSAILVRGLSSEQLSLASGFNGIPDYENEIFLIHPSCLCEQTNCLWCTPWLHTNPEEFSPSEGASDDTTLFSESEANEHRRNQLAEIKRRFAGAKSAPNFWHKPTNLQLRWDRWIGRHMEVNRDLTVEEWITIWKECETSIPVEIRTRAWQWLKRSEPFSASDLYPEIYASILSQNPPS